MKFVEAHNLPNHARSVQIETIEDMF